MKLSKNVGTFQEMKERRGFSAIRDWLPTNFRLHRHDGKSQICDLCQSGSVDDTRHLMPSNSNGTEQSQNGPRTHDDKMEHSVFPTGIITSRTCGKGVRSP